MDIVSHAPRIEYDQYNSQSIIQYGLIGHALKSRDEIASKSAIVAIEYDKSHQAKKNKFSTLFCPACFEFFDIDDKNIIAGYFILNHHPLLY